MAASLRDLYRRFMARSKRTRARQRFDLALREDRSTYCLAALIGVFAFLACLALATALALSHYAGAVGSAGINHMTIEVSPLDERPQDASHPPAPLDARTDAALDILRASPAVGSAAILSDVQIADLLEPWLGDLSTLKSGLPLPRLIDVTLTQAAATDTADGAAEIKKLRESLTASVPGVSIDDHAAILRHTASLTENLSLLAFAALGLIGFAVIVAIILLVNSSLAIHDRTITLLHVIGAADSYIARQFAMFAGYLAMIGTGIGTGLALLSGIALAVSLPKGWFLSVVDWRWLCLPLLPFLFVGLSRLVARVFVLLLLRRLP